VSPENEAVAGSGEPLQRRTPGLADLRMFTTERPTGGRHRPTPGLGRRVGGPAAVTVCSVREAPGPLSEVAAGLPGRPAPDGVVSVGDRPNVARMYDYLLGGFYNFAADRKVAEQVLAVVPDVQRIAGAYRHFLFRAVRYCLRAGVRQFLDVGCGLPSVGCVHEVAQRADPGARVAYVDADPVAVALTGSVLAGNAGVCALRGDVRRPEAILAHADLRRLLDLGQPVAVVLGAVLQFVADDPAGLVARLLAPLPAGSHLVVSHATTDSRTQARQPVELLYQQTATPVAARSRAQVEQLFTGLALVDPGVVWLPQWRPEHGGEIEDPRWSGGLAGVGRKPPPRVVMSPMQRERLSRGDLRRPAATGPRAAP